MRSIYYPRSVTGEINTLLLPDLGRNRSWLDGFYFDPNAEAPVNMPAVTTIIEGAGRAATVLGKRIRKWYEGTHKAPQSLIMTTAVLDHPERG